MTEFAGLPLHPLLVHVAVVLLPLSAAAFIVVAFVPKWRRPFDAIVLVGLVIGTIFAIGAKLSGEGLAEIVGNPVEHAQWGNVLPWVAIALTIVAAIWFWQVRAHSTNAVAITLLSALGSLLAIAVLGLSVLVGHSGAQAVWGGKLTPPQPIPAASSIPSATAASLTLAQVQEHNTADDCWSIVAGNVYNLTDWINEHPGGASVIEGMCGVDATEAFNSEHGSQGRPERELENFLVGPLG